MPQTNILKVNDKIFNELFCDGIGEYVTIVFCGKLFICPIRAL